MRQFRRRQPSVARHVKRHAARVGRCPSAVSLQTKRLQSDVGRSRRQWDSGRRDLALTTREPHPPFVVLRRERLVWALSPDHAAWLCDSVPAAMFEAGDTARRLRDFLAQAMHETRPA